MVKLDQGLRRQGLRQKRNANRLHYRIASTPATPSQSRLGGSIEPIEATQNTN